MSKKIVFLLIASVVMLGLLSRPAEANGNNASLFDEIKKVFHYSSGFEATGKVKKAPSKFDEFLEKALGYPKKEEMK